MLQLESTTCKAEQSRAHQIPGKKERKTKQSKAKQKIAPHNKATTNTTKIHQTFFMFFFRLGAKKKYPIVTMPLDVTMPVDSVIHTTGIFVGREWNGIKSTHTSTWKHARYTLDVSPGWCGPYIECVVWWPRRVKLEQQWLYYYMQAWRWNGNKDSIREPCPYIEMFLKIAKKC